VIARRTRLSFLNAHATLEALPRIVDIMGEEMGWSLAHKTRELERATIFLESMGLQPGVAPPAANARDLLEKVESALYTGFGTRTRASAGSVVPPMPYSRAQFEAGEVDALRRAFEVRAKAVPPSNGTLEPVRRLARADLRALVGSVQGYETVSDKEVAYVLEEAGFASRQDVDFDEFVEVRLTSWVLRDGCRADTRSRLDLCGVERGFQCADGARGEDEEEEDTGRAYRRWRMNDLRLRATRVE
jgi:glycerol-3-phosphate dehydrogenase